MNKSIGQIAYEAAAAVTGCEQPWSEANQEKWEAAAAGVREYDASTNSSETGSKLVLEDIVAATESEIVTIKRFLEEIDHAQKSSADWFPNGDGGLFMQIRVWLDNANKAVDNLEEIIRAMDK